MASKPNTARQHKHFAVLIDADNVPAAIVEGIFKNVAKASSSSIAIPNALSHGFKAKNWLNK